MYSYKEVESAIEKEPLSDSLYKLQRLAQQANSHHLARWCSHELNGYSGATTEELEASNAYRKVPVEWRDVFQRPIRIDHKLSFLNSVPLHLGVADIEAYSADGVLLGYPDLMETLQPLCNGPIAGAYFPPDQLRALLKRIKLSARSRLHDSIPRPKESEVVTSKQRARPGFVDSLIILFVSAALVIFLFWIASQTLRLDTFLTIPSFIQNSFKAIWTSIAAGTAGVGLAVYKALTRSPGESSPNYLFLVGITTASMIVFIFLLLYVMSSVGPRARLSPPADTELIEIGSSSSVAHTLHIKGDPTSPVFYEISGKYAVRGRTIQGSIEEGTVTINKDFTTQLPIHFQTLFISLCFIDRAQGNDFMNIFPDTRFPQWSNSVRLAFDASPGLRQEIPKMNFKIDLPVEIRSDKVWLCSGLAHSMGGYYPAHQVSAGAN
jgi:AbiTii